MGLVESAMNGVVTVVTDTTGKVENVFLRGIDTAGITVIDTQRNIAQSYMDTQANVLTVLNNAGLGIYNVAQQGQRNLFSVARDTETRILSVIDSILDRASDIVNNVIDGVGFLVVLWFMAIGGFWMLFNKEIFKLLDKLIDRL